jgi:hypothetical protein
MSEQKSMIRLDKGDPTDFPICMIVTGEQGTGKSFNVAAAYPDYLYVQSRPTALANLADWIKKNPDEAKKRGMKIPEYRQTVNPDAGLLKKNGFKVYDWWVQFWNWWYVESKAGRIPYPGVVIDEENNFLDAIYLELKQPDNEHTGGDGFAAINLTKEAAALPLIANRLTRKGQISIYHWDGISYVLDGDGNPTHEVQYPAGPATPIGTMRREHSQKFDAVWQLLATGMRGNMPTREFLIQPSTNEIRKPGFGTKQAKIRIDDKKNLREVLAELKAKELEQAEENRG